jgi:hypothetical protein
MFILITAFTIGHSLTLALSVLQVFVVNMALVEFLIAVTIIATCLYNIKIRNELETTKQLTAYIMAAIFGLIHGLGFASVLKEMLSDQSILVPLFSFNIGLEVGQLVVVVTLLLLSQLVRTIFQIKQQILNFFISTVIASVALIVAVNRFIEIFHH